MKIVPTLVWRPADPGAAALDARLVELLLGIRTHATLRAAAHAAGMSYRAAWGLLGDTARALGVALVQLQQGRGAQLTSAGEQFLAAHEQASQRLREGGAGLEFIVPAPAPATRTRAQLALVVSHDLLLAAFCEQWAKPEGIVGDVVFRGSIESLKALARGDADIAGFHTVVPARAANTGNFRRALDPRRDVLIRFAEREQGLIVPKGNPKRLTALADIAARNVVFVNRQRGSGTRLLVDQLLKQANLTPGAIRGYDTEEYTHLAVAATVAAGQAQAGFGLKAAAARLDLDFVPLAREIYWLALRARKLDTEPVRRLCSGLSGDPLRRAVRGLAGYSIDTAGTVVPLAAATI